MSDSLIIAENDEKYVDTSCNTQSTPLELTTKHISRPEDFDFATPVKTTKMVIENEIAKYTYPIQMTNLIERENWTISTDHCYAKPWNWRPEANFLRPTKTLFMPKEMPARTKAFNPLAPQEKTEDIIDIEAETEVPTPVYDVSKARSLMEECETHAKLARNGQDDDEWEDKIVKINWTNTQHRIFNTVLAILDSFHMAKLSYNGNNNEPIIRRTMIDKAVQRFRKLLSSVGWDSKVTQWLHQLLIDNLTMSYLAMYLEVLQTLKSKLPSFVEKMMYGPNASVRMGLLNNENLFPLVKKPWDPVSHSLNQDKPKKLPGNPIIVFVPSSPIMSKRAHTWISLLSHLATVVTVPANFGSSWYRVTVTSCLDQTFSVTKGKIQEIRETYPGRQIILAGSGAGATLALQIAQVEQVLCVVSLGFSLLTVEGRRGEPDDNLLELQVPVLFVIGQCSNTSLQEDMEDLRERMRVETGLIVVGSADDALRVNKKKKREEGITQSIVDRCIVDEIGEFISGVILSPYPPQIRQSPTSNLADAVKKGKHERKRYSSNASSVDSEPPSPTTRLSRPVGRPPGSKTKSKLEAKWAQQVAQGTPPSPPPTAPSTPPPLAAIVNAPEGLAAAGEGAAPAGGASPPRPPPAVKKIKTLLPVKDGGGGGDAAATTAKGGPARMQAYNLNRNITPGGQLSTLLQGGIKTIPPVQKSSGSGIKVLEDVTLSSGATAKLIAGSSPSSSATGIAKLTTINAVSSAKGVAAASMGNVLLLPNGKIRAVPHAGPLPPKAASANPVLAPASPTKGTKYITSKKQFITKTVRTPKRPQSYIPSPAAIQTNLPPPTNLTPNDIMDLPIIFADDNQIIDPNLPTDLTTTSKQTTLPKIVGAPPINKFLLVTKPGPNSGSFIVSPSTVKRPVPLSFNKQPAKYAKIILSKKTDEILPRLSSEITLKKVEKAAEAAGGSQLEAIDLENELVATAVPKPNLSTSTVKNITIIPKKSGEFTIAALPTGQGFAKVGEGEEKVEDDDDPDYVPPKNLKL